MIGKWETFVVVSKESMAVYLKDSTVGFSTPNRSIYYLKRQANVRTRRWYAGALNFGTGETLLVVGKESMVLYLTG